MNPISIIKNVLYAYEVWSAAISNLFVSFYVITMFFVIMQFILIRKKRYIKSFISICIFLFSYCLAFLLVAGHPPIFSDTHGRHSWYLLPSAYLFFGAVLYAFSAIKFPSKNIFRVLAFSCISIILYNAPKMNEYYSTMISYGVMYSIDGDYTKQEKEFLQLLNDHGIKKGIITRCLGQNYS